METVGKEKVRTKKIHAQIQQQKQEEKCEICSKLTIKRLELRQCFTLFLLLTLNK